MPLSSFSPEYQMALDALKVASDIAKTHFRKEIDIDIKADSSPVTMVDRTIEAMMRKTIQAQFSTDLIFGEEEGGEKTGERLWIIDPIDGTQSFIAGNPLFGCLIGFLEENTPKIGAIAMPALDELWIGERGKHCTYNGEICTTRPYRRLDKTVMLSTAPNIFSEEEAIIVKRLQEKIGFYRLGGDCYLYAMLAAGWADIVIEATLKPYDFFPLIPVVEAAGGVISDWQGNALTMQSNGQVLATGSPELHQQVLDLMKA